MGVRLGVQENKKSMSYIYNDLTIEQKCAILGFAIDFCGCGNSTPMQFAKLQDILSNIGEELEVSKDRVEAFVNKMQVNGRLEYAINVLKTIKNKRLLGCLYPQFYSIVATLNSKEGLAKLDKIYNDEFGYDKEEIKLLWDLYQIKDFRNNGSISVKRTNSSPSVSNTGGQGCIVLALAISTSILACLFGIVLIVM